MDQTAPAVDWTVARDQELLRRDKRSLGQNIFAGVAQYHKAQLAGIGVTRLTVLPPGQLLPPSAAVVSNTAWEEAAQLLPLQMHWQQSMPGTFDITFSLSADAVCFGLGERFSGLNIRGAIHTLTTTDQTRHNESADAFYKAIPLCIIGSGTNYSAIFLDSSAPQRWDLDADLTALGGIELFTRRGWQLYVLGSASLPEIVAAYTELTGRGCMPPLWALGHQQCRWSYPDEATVTHIALEFRRRQIPCDTIVLDIDYMDEYRVFTTSPARFPDLKGLAEKLRQQNFKIVTIVDPGVKVDARYSIYKESVAGKFVCVNADGTPFIEEVWPGDCVFPDFSNVATRDWWGKHLEFYTSNGVAGIWNDMNEPSFFKLKNPTPKLICQMPEDADQPFFQRDSTGTVGHLEVRNLYGSLMSQSTFEGLTEVEPNKRPFVLTRSAYAGVQRYSAVWLGDNMSWWQHLELSIPMLLNMGLSGVPFAGVDVGGFAGDCSAELLVRWYETGIFYPFFRNHCRLGDRAQEPWAFGAEVERHIRSLIEVRYSLLPYIYSLFWENRDNGAPLMRPLSWHYPDDRYAIRVSDQFMFGAEILVAPILERGSVTRPVYLPRGLWHPFGGGEALQGEQLHLVHFPLGTVPAFVRDGAIIPLLSSVQSTVEYHKSDITFRVFGKTATGTFVDDDGESFGYASGQFNKWQLSYSNEQFTANSQHSGFVGSDRQYFVAAADSVRTVNLK